jgi:hypothetical protein
MCGERMPQGVAVGPPGQPHSPLAFGSFLGSAPGI